MGKGQKRSTKTVTKGAGLKPLAAKRVSAEKAAEVRGGKGTLSDIHFTHPADKSSP